MKVLQVLAKSVGGIRQHVATLNKELNVQGVSSDIAGPDNVMEGLCDQEFSFSSPSMKNPLSILKAVDFLASKIAHYDVVHAHGLTAAKLSSMVIKKAGKQIPLVVTAHNVVDPFANGKKYRLMKSFESHVFRIADSIIFPSNFALQQSSLAQADLHKSKVILPVGRTIEDIDVQKALDNREKIRSSYMSNTSDPLVVSIARYSKQKDLETLIVAFSKVLKQIKNAKLIIGGSGSETYKSDLAFLVEKLEIKDSVVLSGFVESPNELIAAADVLAISSRFETVPFVLLESLRLGTPVVTTDTGIAAELSDIESVKVVDVANAKEMSNSMISLLQNNSRDNISIAKDCAENKVFQKYINHKDLIIDIIQQYEAILKPAV